MRSIFALFAMIFLVGCAEKPVEFQQVYSGTNGPTRVGVQYFSTAGDLEGSWIKSALDQTSYEKLLSQVDFTKQSIVAYSAGKMDAFSGTIEIASVYQYTGAEDLPMNVRVKVGVLKNECRDERITLPFVLAVIKRPSKFQPSGGYDRENFEDGCPRAD